MFSTFSNLAYFVYIIFVARERGVNMPTTIPATRTSLDNFPAASLRHYHDGTVLHTAGCSENALCHYAFSVECAQKAFLFWRYPMPRQYRLHSVTSSEVSKCMLAWATLDGALSATLPTASIPPKLMEDHPSRRYRKRFPISAQELENCKTYAASMEQNVITMILDGLIQVK